MCVGCAPLHESDESVQRAVQHDDVAGAEQQHEAAVHAVRDEALPLRHQPRQLLKHVCKETTGMDR